MRIDSADDSGPDWEQILFGTQYTLDKKAVEEMHASLAEGKQE